MRGVSVKPQPVQRLQAPPTVPPSHPPQQRAPRRRPAYSATSSKNGRSAAFARIDTGTGAVQPVTATNEATNKSRKRSPLADSMPPANQESVQGSASTVKAPKAAEMSQATRIHIGRPTKVTRAGVATKEKRWLHPIQLVQNTKT